MYVTHVHLLRKEAADDFSLGRETMHGQIWRTPGTSAIIKCGFFFRQVTLD